MLYKCVQRLIVFKSNRLLTTTTQNQVCRADEVKNCHHDPSKRFLSLKQIPTVRKNRYKAVGRICVRHQDSIKTKQLKPFVVLPAGVRLKYLMSKVCFRFVFCDKLPNEMYATKSIA